MLGQSQDNAHGVSHKTSNERPSASNDCSVEQWYLRIDYTMYGPVSRSGLEQFLRPPRLCSMLQVMCSTDHGQWHSISKNETIDKVYLKFGIKDATSALPPLVTRPSWGRSRFEMFAEAISETSQSIFSVIFRFRTQSAALLLIISANVVVSYLTSDGSARDRQILKQFESIWDSARRFDKADASQDEWREFADHEIGAITSILTELQRTASVRRPARQALLFAGRDGLMKLLQEPTPAAIDSEVGTQIEVRLHQAHKSLPKD